MVYSVKRAGLTGKCGGAAIAVVALALSMHRFVSAQPLPAASFEEYLRRSAPPRDVLDTFLQGPAWAQFDPELGYVLGNYLPPIGMDRSRTISTIQPNGARTSFMYAGRKARINTYGDSFTECMQVSDGETWQEALAAHLGEPIRNFGVGGYGVYQAYRRMLHEESTEHAAEYVIFYIWGDDHIRSLLRARYAAIYSWWYPDDTQEGGRMFHANFWPHLEMDLKTGQFMEKENELPTKESLYRMSEPEWMAKNLRDDVALQLMVYSQRLISSLERKAVSRLAQKLNFPLDWTLDESALRQQAANLLDRYSMAATLYVLNKVRAFTHQKGKKLLVVLFDPYRVATQRKIVDEKSLAQANLSGQRYDQPVVDYLIREKVDYFDMNEVHLRDYKKYAISWQEYMDQYLIGHYNPLGNRFFAASIKDTVVGWLEPKPVSYQKTDVRAIDFKGYLYGY